MFDMFFKFYLWPRVAGRMEVVEVRRPEARQQQPEFDDEQEIITLSPEVKRFSGEGGKQTFAVDVKASFSPHPDNHQVEYMFFFKWSRIEFGNYDCGKHC